MTPRDEPGGPFRQRRAGPRRPSGGRPRTEEAAGRCVSRGPRSKPRVAGEALPGRRATRDVQAKTIEILKQAADKELTSGRGPTGVAAAAIYIASILSGERRTQREVAEVAGVTEVTIRNRYKELAERLDIDIVL